MVDYVQFELPVVNPGGAIREVLGLGGGERGRWSLAPWSKV